MLLLLAGAADCTSKFPCSKTQVATDAHTGRKDADISKQATAQTRDVKDRRITRPRWARGREGGCWQTVGRR